MWGYDTTFGLNVICMTLEIINFPKLLYLKQWLFVYLYMSEPLVVSLTHTACVGLVFTHATRH
jgi:hypothetical protein